MAREKSAYWQGLQRQLRLYLGSLVLVLGLVGVLPWVFMAGAGLPSYAFCLSIPAVLAVLAVLFGPLLLKTLGQVFHHDPDFFWELVAQEEAGRNMHQLSALLEKRHWALHPVGQQIFRPGAGPQSPIKGLELLFDLPATGTALMDSRMEILRVNRQLVDFFGYEAQDLARLKWIEVTHPDDRQRSIETLENHLAQGKGEYTILKRYLHRSGKTLYGQTSLRTIRDSEGNIRYYLVFIRDLTPQQETVERLQKSEANLKALVENTDNHIWAVDQDCRLITCNQQFRQILNSIGKEVSEGMQALELAPAPETRELWENLYKKALEGQKFKFENEYPQRGEGGQSYVINYSFSPIYDAENRVAGCTVVGRDVTEYRLQQRQLKENALSLQGVINNTDDRIWLFNPNLELQVSNEANNQFLEERYGKVPPLGTVMRFDFFPTKAEADFWRNSYRQALNGKKLRFERKLDYPAGEEKWFDFSLRPLFDAEGQVEGVVGTGRDISLQKRHELELAYHRSRLEQRVKEQTIELRQKIEALEAAERMLKASEAHFRALAEQAEGYFIFRLAIGQAANQAYNFLEVSPSICAIMGLAEHERYSLQKALERAKHSDPVGLFRLYRQVLSPPYRLDQILQIEHPNGEWRWLHVFGSGIRSAEQVEAFNGLVLDITERRRAEQKQQETAAHLEAFYRSAKDFGLYRVRIHLEEEYLLEPILVSPSLQDLYGLEAHQLYDISAWYSRMLPEDREKVLAASYRTHNQGQGAFAMEYRIQHPQKGLRWLSTRSVRSESYDGIHTYFNAFIIDITEQKKAEEELKSHRQHLQYLVENRTKALMNEIEERKSAERQLERALKEKTNLLAEVHHRVKNNLTMVATLQRMHMDKLQNPQLQNILRYSMERIEVLADIHQRLYEAPDFSEIELGNYLEGLASDIILSLQQEKAIELDSRVCELTVDIDKAIAAGLLLNEIATNSIKYAFEQVDSPEIRLRLSLQQTGLARLEIGDNGPGMPQGASENDQNLGSDLIQAFAADIQGQLSCRNQGGLQYIIDFRY